MTLSSSVKLNNPDKHYKANQKIYFAGMPIYSDGNAMYIGSENFTALSGTLHTEIVTASGVLQAQIDDIYVSLATFGTETVVSGVDSVYVTFSGIQAEGYYISAIVKNTVDSNPKYIGCMITEATESGINFKLSDTTDSENYLVDWILRR